MADDDYILDITDYAKLNCVVSWSHHAYIRTWFRMTLQNWVVHATGTEWMSSITACKGLLLSYDDEERPLVTEFWRESDFIGFSIQAPTEAWSMTSVRVV